MAGAVLRFYATLRQARMLRRLAVGREDIALWRTVAGRPLDESPLTDLRIRDGLKKLRV